MLLITLFISSFLSYDELHTIDPAGSRFGIPWDPAGFSSDYGFFSTLISLHRHFFL